MNNDAVSMLRFDRFGHNNTEFPLSDLRLNENAMCWRSDAKSRTTGRQFNSLRNDFTHDCINYEGGEELWTSHFKLNEKELFDMNPISEYFPYIKAFNFYEESKNGTDYAYKLFSRKYIMVKKWECREKISEFAKQYEDVEEFEDKEMAVFIFKCIWLPIGACCVTYYATILEDEQARYIPKRRNRCKKLILYTYLCVLLGVLIHEFALFESRYQAFKTFIDEDCFSGFVETRA